VPFERQARRAVVGENLLDQRHRRQLGGWFVVVQAGQQRHRTDPLLLPQRLPQGGPPIDRE
jgi:hypothetical protein